MIRMHSDGSRIYDLDSANGTMVNDRDVDQPVLLQVAATSLPWPTSSSSSIFPTEAELRPTPPASRPDGYGGRSGKKTPIIVLVTDIVNFSGISRRSLRSNSPRVRNVRSRGLPPPDGGVGKGQIKEQVTVETGCSGTGGRHSPEVSRAELSRVARQLVCGPAESCPSSVGRADAQKGRLHPVRGRPAHRNRRHRVRHGGPGPPWVTWSTSRSASRPLPGI